MQYGREVTLSAFFFLKSNMGINMHKQTNFWEWVKQTFTPHYVKEIEQFLSDATDHYDLEHRMNILVRRGMI
jgi:hypothetical protein